MKPARIIDSHQHVFWHGRDAAGLIADMDAYGIEHAWILSWEIAPFEDSPAYHEVLNPIHVRSDGTHAGIPLADLILARDRYPTRFVLGYCPHPMQPMAPDLLKASVQIHGVRVCGEWKFRIPFDDPRCIRIFRTAGDLGLPVVLHLDVPFLPDEKGGQIYDSKWYGGTVDNLERALRACPATIFIGHAPGFWREISGDAASDSALYPKGRVTPGGRLYALLEEHGNLFADLSAGSGRYALQRDPGHAVEFIQRFPDRLLFARDYYGGDLHEFLQTLPLTQDLADMIYFRNAERLVKPPASSK